MTEDDDELVCAWRDVYERDLRQVHDDQGRAIKTWTACAYCGRTELHRGKLGRQTHEHPVVWPQDTHVRQTPSAPLATSAASWRTSCAP